jgi:DNA mismatch endonuclease (patch repair protein)
MLWGLGYRYRLHVSDLAGRPDIVMRARRLVIFVHGCLWHLHDNCALVRVPRSRPGYWPAKLARNRARDARNVAELERGGWRVVVIWECETRNPELLASRLREALRA